MFERSPKFTITSTSDGRHQSSSGHTHVPETNFMTLQALARWLSSGYELSRVFLRGNEIFKFHRSEYCLDVKKIIDLVRRCQAQPQPSGPQQHVECLHEERMLPRVFCLCIQFFGCAEVGTVLLQCQSYCTVYVRSAIREGRLEPEGRAEQ